MEILPVQYAGDSEDPQPGPTYRFGVLIEEFYVVVIKLSLARQDATYKVSTNYLQDGMEAINL